MQNKKKVAYTIVNNPYLHFAIALSESFISLHEDYEFKIYLLDSHLNRSKELLSNVEIIEVDTEIIPDLNQRAFYYDITELSTSIKPNIMLDLLKSNYELVCYIDPDIKFFSRMSEVERSLEHNNFVVTPHATTPIYDGKRPDDLNFLRTGAYNLGFIAVKNSSESIAFANWWMQRLQYNGFSAYSAGTFTDQKWIDLLPSYFDGVHILKDPGYNVSYWNLHERDVQGEYEAPFVNGRDLVFYHFSGINLKDNSISKYQTRFQDYPSETLSSIFSIYRKECLKILEGINNSSIKYKSLADGSKIDSLSRMLFFHHIINGYLGDVNPFSLNRKSLNKLLISDWSRYKSNIPTYYLDFRIESYGTKINRIPKFLKKAILNLAYSRFGEKILTSTNNSVNKINVSSLILRLTK
ncbi:hypothetical protein [Deinococcus soli (ex Cha et al. 2016)]|uniref:hypothetical protein n=1 Tax=Deinococcus soli (ex Cha et al. 2016) TaxID=1309411 RepID=UPI00166F1F9E|nr:hypothetical protein [Deinococcus soli (ex Cha et al. 2016)]GGB76793.1 hypothetical protein GCM10008019_36280 [Deinococcus soli (ex Cha et al. 2016)]